MLAWFFVGIHLIGISGAAERDRLPVQPGKGVSYRLYRCLDAAVCGLMLLWLILILLPEPALRMKAGFGLLIVAVCLLREIGTRKYRPKKPENSD